MAKILFFADRLPPLIGGMEIHAGYFIDHFKDDIVGIVSQSFVGSNLFDPEIVFFNSGRWIEELKDIRKLFPKARFFYRTGGNEILKAPLSVKTIADHRSRQAYWVRTINETIDVLITNSFYTEKRLADIGVNCHFERVVGGVNDSALKDVERASGDFFTIFCGARFVSYKNHFLLIDVVQSLISKGYKIKLKLAGDGPQLSKVKDYVTSDNIEFLGALSNEGNCFEIARANLYMQLSTDRLTAVPGGHYLHSECMGRSILEAITAGTYVVAGRSGALSEIVTGNRGLLVDLNDVDRIVFELEKIIKFRPSNDFSDEFSWKNVFGRYEEIFYEKNTSCNREK